MASIIIADNTEHYDGRDLEARPLGGTESSVIRMARELARRRHQVTVYTNCDGPIEHEGVQWRPLSGTPPASCSSQLLPKLETILRSERRPSEAGFYHTGQNRGNPRKRLRSFVFEWRSRIGEEVPPTAG